MYPLAGIQHPLFKVKIIKNSIKKPADFPAVFDWQDLMALIHAMLNYDHKSFGFMPFHCQH